MGFWVWLVKKFIKLVTCPEARFVYPLIIGSIITVLLPVYEFYLEESKDG